MMMMIDQMVVHRLDMDTSGIVTFGRSIEATKILHTDFRGDDDDDDGRRRRHRQRQQRRHVKKSYEALLCGHLHPSIVSGEIDLPLKVDHRCAPFMCVETPNLQREAQSLHKSSSSTTSSSSTNEQQQQQQQQPKYAKWKKMVTKRAKPSKTLFRVIQREYLNTNCKIKQNNNNNKHKNNNHNNNNNNNNNRKTNKQQQLPVTRVELTPITGRTHQLRVHCAAIGHPIVADPAYGIMGEASPNGGIKELVIKDIMPSRASPLLQIHIHSFLRGEGGREDEDDDNNDDGNDDDLYHDDDNDNDVLAHLLSSMRKEMKKKGTHHGEKDKENDNENENEKNSITSRVPCMCLHAKRLEIQHPITGKDMVFECPPDF
eukprot:CAMPEP_0184873346 /NCGR_PEP_ID=MMETSP0580-20130426/41794_1 /TAXON_ID=1118495 /ORGANISM="Dactyliosolen fragilissimus" /LENGTH=372 /DNA_ID=CAMNT_0027376245 /DNA_START=257 /DNA_END=1375 /DNA_ORIENTATION=-